MENEVNRLLHVKEKIVFMVAFLVAVIPVSILSLSQTSSLPVVQVFKLVVLVPANILMGRKVGQPTHNLNRNPNTNCILNPNLIPTF
mmetsp:Transcript_35906/g.112720  ORF Transcript_35906/g.112720 Transcript_35906/m.112720 type:complete len:87 (+) Transcript_35906:99-359(+)